MLTAHSRCVAFFLTLCFAGNIAFADRSAYVRFDVRPVIVAKPSPTPADLFVPEGYRLVQLAIDVSSLIDAPRQSKPHEFLYHMDFVNPNTRVVDYSPRTRLSDTTVGGIQVEHSDEKTEAFGIAMKGAYAGIVGDGGFDSGRKQSEKLKYERVAQQEIVYASGTVLRGRGVYFKLRSTPQHVLDGEKRFTVTLQVPEAWRGSLIDMRLQASEKVRPFPTMAAESVITSDARYHVAIVNENDAAARRAAWDLGESEQRLREVAGKHARQIRERSAPTIFHHVGIALDVIRPRIEDNWLKRTLHGTVDPYFDRQLRELPVDVRVAVLDYLETKKSFKGLVNPEESSQEARSELAAR